MYASKELIYAVAIALRLRQLCGQSALPVLEGPAHLQVVVSYALNP
jgi:hypothetical protein